jgi:hypothetical protein
MADLVPQGGNRRKWFWDRSFNEDREWRLGAEVTGEPTLEDRTVVAIRARTRTIREARKPEM